MIYQVPVPRYFSSLTLCQFMGLLYSAGARGMVLGQIDQSRHQNERARSVNQRRSMTENPFMKLPLVLLRDHRRINQKGSDSHAHQPINKTRITVNLQMKPLVSVDRFAMLTRQATDGLLLLQAIGLLGFSWVFRRGSAELGLWARVTAQGTGHGLRVMGLYSGLIFGAGF